MRILIEDTGMEIPDDQKPFLFEPFYRGDSSRSKCYGGTGLGLAFAKEAVQLYQGEITVENVHPAGSRFIIRLPGIVI